MTTPPVESQRPRLATAVKWLLGLAVAVGIAPFVFFAVKGVLGFALFAGIVAATAKFAPVVAFKLSNLQLRAIASEARANPIETMRSLEIEKTRELEEADQNIVDFEAEIGNYDDEMRDFKRQYPDEAPRFQEYSDKMHELLTLMQQRQTEAKAKLREFEQRITKAEAIYNMSLAAERVTKLSRSAEAQVFAQIKEKVAFQAVTTELNRSFAQLSLAVSQRVERPALTPKASS